MNFNIITQKGRGVMTYDKAEDVRTDIWLALKIVRKSATRAGSWHMFPDFGLDLSEIQQVTDETVLLLKQEIERALVHLIDAQRVLSLIVTTENDRQDVNTINARIEVIQLDQIPMLFTGFVCVAGPSQGFTVT